ncbi:maleylpyruvate isomerase N-terminal domain-containing protein [Actinomadura oligospora]|uniref:maleylpyruvate isomerase N-terminal domain-containing protein n=1 Tax=Actinomadura oligospora TaxID=111804 RepID=UPI00047A010E|nr:maleylpyruvate isomerase N-terminal domain-containing protein [Actinomadura oligospora]
MAHEKWHEIRASLQETGERFADLVSAAPDPSAMATDAWTIADTVAHVAAISWLDAVLIDPDAPEPPVPDLLERLRAINVDGVHAFNVVVLDAFAERDAKALLDRLRECLAFMHDRTADRDPSETVSWIGGAQLPLAGLFGHMINELLLHGYDIAASLGRPWDIPSRDASYFFGEFIVGMSRNGLGHLLDGGGRPRPRPISVEFRSAYTDPVVLRLHNGVITAHAPDGAPDVRVTFDPAAFNLMMFGRLSKPRAALTRKVTVGGRRPWLLPTFLKTVRVPS